MPDFGIGGPNFGLRDGKVATWNGDGTYGTNVDIPSIQLLGISIQTTNAQLEGDDVITDVHAKAISGQFRLRFGGKISQAVMEILTGRTRESSGVTPNRVSRIKYTGLNFPWVGACGRADATNGAGDTHTWIPKFKITEGFEAVYEYGNYSIPELTCMAVPDDQYTTTGENETQTVSITGTPTGGTFTLTFRGQTTGNIAFDAAAAAVESAFEALSTVGAGNGTVSGSNPNFTVTFTGDLANTPLPLITAADALTGGSSPEVVIAQTNAGVAADPVIFEDIEHETAYPVLVPPI